MITIREATQEDAARVLKALRQDEIDELEALGTTCEANLYAGLETGTALAAYFGDEVAGVFGVFRTESMVFPWGVFTTQIDKHPIAFLRACRRWRDELTLPAVNYVDVRNERAIKWFEWLGFDISEPQACGKKGELFSQVRYLPL